MEKRTFTGFNTDIKNIKNNNDNLQQGFILIITDKDNPNDNMNIKFFPLITANLQDAIKQYTLLVAPNKEIIGYYSLKFLIEQVEGIAALAEENDMDFQQILKNSTKYIENDS